MVDVDQFQRRERPLPFSIIALEAPHPLSHLGQPIVPSLLLEQVPKRVRVKDSNVAAMARHLDGVMPARDVEKVADGVYEGPTHGLPN